jgi:hypothetical protein
MAQKKPVRSLESLTSLLSETEKETLKQEQEKIEKQHKKTLEVIAGMDSSLVKKKISEKEFTEMYDSLTLAKTKFLSGTDKDGDYIIHNKNKYIRTYIETTVV